MSMNVDSKETLSIEQELAKYSNCKEYNEIYIY
jgi:hypothetical protein|nr:MAG TPA: hypothetical protein [Caudoviricetes sp.]